MANGPCARLAIAKVKQCWSVIHRVTNKFIILISIFGGHAPVFAVVSTHPAPRPRGGLWRVMSDP
jgi:hypothetical protein